MNAASISNSTAPAGDRDEEEEEEEAMAPPRTARERKSEGVEKAWVMGRAGRRKRRRARRGRVGSLVGGMLFGVWEDRELGGQGVSCFVLGEGRLFVWKGEGEK